MTTIDTPDFLHLSVKGSATEPTRTIEAAWTVPLGRYTAASVTVASPMNPVLTPDLARSAVRRTIAAGLRAPLLEANPHLAGIAAVDAWVRGDGHRARRIAASRAKHPDAALLEQAALVVRLERIVGGFAVRTMERCMGINYPTAKRWMGLLRRRGMVA